jgi:hypothetical protein
MAFTRANLTAIARGNGFTLWHYTTEDSAADVDLSGYFDDAAAELGVGDLVLRVTTSAGAVSTAGFHIVMTNDGTTVNMSDTTALTVTNTD